tara:strand:+ start:1498 stop:1680 length:183 start_codon:yes stop_codon:yes gene_type:complete
MAKKYLISIVVMAVIYLGISYLFSAFFGRDFNWSQRLISGMFFGILITVFQVFITKKKKR